MLAYIFWHVSGPDTEVSAYETALINFHRHLADDAPRGFEYSTTYRISSVPWLSDRPGYEDWYLIDSPSALERLNTAAIKPERWDVHASVSYKTDFGHGGLYYHLQGEKHSARATKLVWLKRPKRIRYEAPLTEIIGSSFGFLSCWRKFMVLGPADEFAILGDETLNIQAPSGWSSISVERHRLI
jgi:hypothetical protein